MLQIYKCFMINPMMLIKFCLLCCSHLTSQLIFEVLLISFFKYFTLAFIFYIFSFVFLPAFTPNMFLLSVFMYRTHGGDIQIVPQARLGDSYGGPQRGHDRYCGAFPCTPERCPYQSLSGPCI